VGEEQIPNKFLRQTAGFPTVNFIKQRKSWYKTDQETKNDWKKIKKIPNLCWCLWNVFFLIMNA
jgi:hypothetical protein